MGVDKNIVLIEVLASIQSCCCLFLILDSFGINKTNSSLLASLFLELKMFSLCFSLFYHVFLLYSLTSPPPIHLGWPIDGQKAGGCFLLVSLVETLTANSNCPKSVRLNLVFIIQVSKPCFIILSNTFIYAQNFQVQVQKDMLLVLCNWSYHCCWETLRNSIISMFQRTKI